MIVKQKDVVVRKPEWKDCVLHVSDVGDFSVWGVLIDIRENHVVNEMAVFPLDDEWLPAFTVEEVLQAIKTKKEKK